VAGQGAPARKGKQPAAGAVSSCFHPCPKGQQSKHSTNVLALGASRLGVHQDSSLGTRLCATAHDSVSILQMLPASQILVLFCLFCKTPTVTHTVTDSCYKQLQSERIFLLWKNSQRVFLPGTDLPGTSRCPSKGQAVAPFLGNPTSWPGNPPGLK